MFTSGCARRAFQTGRIAAGRDGFPNPAAVPPRRSQGSHLAARSDGPGGARAPREDLSMGPQARGEAETYTRTRCWRDQFLMARLLAILALGRCALCLVEPSKLPLCRESPGDLAVRHEICSERLKGQQEPICGPRSEAWN